MALPVCIIGRVVSAWALLRGSYVLGTAWGMSLLYLGRIVLYLVNWKIRTKPPPVYLHTSYCCGRAECASRCWPSPYSSHTTSQSPPTTAAPRIVYRENRTYLCSQCSLINVVVSGCGVMSSWLCGCYCTWLWLWIWLWLRVWAQTRGVAAAACPVPTL